MVISNVRIFYTIAQESYLKIESDEKERSIPKNNGENGNIKIYDPKQTSFKCAFITIVFSCACLEALLHLLIVKQFGEDEYKKLDKCLYEAKLKKLGCNDVMILANGEYLRKTRIEILHEKAWFNQEKIKIAQEEAKKSMIALNSICCFLNVDLSIT